MAMMTNLVRAKRQPSSQVHAVWRRRQPGKAVELGYIVVAIPATALEALNSTEPLTKMILVAS